MKVPVKATHEVVALHSRIGGVLRTGITSAQIAPPVPEGCAGSIIYILTLKDHTTWYIDDL
jgi:hypothetical protein